MKQFKSGLIVVMTVSIAGFFQPAFVSGEMPGTKANAAVDVPAQPNDAPADNTKRNKRDREDTTLTPPDQADGSANDVEVTRRIRRAIMADKSLSTNAHNIKIITLNGQVTLRGPVENAGEKQAVLGKAEHVAGARNVKSELEIKRP
jgi:osmotically-inducible protein OsmY